MFGYPDSYYNELGESRDRRCYPGTLYVGEISGYTYTGNGYYENDSIGSDIYIERDSDGNIHYHHSL